MTNSVRQIHDRLLRSWGFEGHAYKERPRIVEVSASFADQLVEDMRIIGNAITRIAPTGRLSIGAAADAFTHGVGASPSTTPTPFIARPDIILRNGNPQILELNVDSSLGGTVEVSVLAKAYAESGLYGNKQKFLAPLDALARFIEPFVKHSADQGELNVLVLTSRTFSEYDRLNAVAMSNWISEQLGTSCCVGYPDEIEIADFVYCARKRIQVMIKLDVMIDERETSSFASLLKKASKSQTAIISDNQFVGVEDKAAIALLQGMCSESGALSERERETIQRITTPSWLLSMPPPSDASSWMEYLISAQEHLVLKRCFSFGGSKVVCGPTQQPEHWLAHCKSALAAPDLWIVQQFVQGDTLVFDSLGVGRLVPEQCPNEDVSCVLSPFVYGDQIGGFLCRVSRTEGNPVVGLASSARTGFYIVSILDP